MISALYAKRLCSALYVKSHLVVCAAGCRDVVEEISNIRTVLGHPARTVLRGVCLTPFSRQPLPQTALLAGNSFCLHRRCQPALGSLGLSVLRNIVHPRTWPHPQIDENADGHVTFVECMAGLQERTKNPRLTLNTRYTSARTLSIYLRCHHEF